MSIRNRVLILTTLLFIGLTAVAIYFSSTLRFARGEMDNADRSVRALLQGYATRAALNRQLKEYFDASTPELADQKNESSRFESIARENFQAWINIRAGAEKHDRAPQSQAEIERIYQDFDARAEEFHSQGAARPVAADTKFHPPIDLQMLHEIGNVLRYEVAEMRAAYRRTLWAAGSMPWTAGRVEEVVNRSDRTLDAFLAVTALRTDLLRQIQALAEIAVTGNEAARARMERHRFGGFDALEEWEQAIASGRAAGAAGPGWDTETPAQLRELYGRIQDLIDRVLPVIEEGQAAQVPPGEANGEAPGAAAIAFIEDDIEALADSALLPVFDLTTAAYEEQIRGLHTEIRGILHRGGVAGLAISAALGIAIAIFSITSVRRIVKGLDILRAGTTHIAGGEWSHRIQLDSNDEFGRIAADFNGMMEVLSNTSTSVKYLEAEIEERIWTQKALEQARESAERAASAKTNFLANMSHEIRTPMNGVIGMTGLLLNTEVSDLQREYLSTIQRSADSLLAIINDILDFSKIDAGKLELDEIDFDLRRQLESVNDILAWRAQEKGLEYTCLIENDVPTALRGDPGRLQQVLTNLVSNAVKFTHHGDISVRASLLENLGSRVGLRFDVHDTGIGIDEGRVLDLFNAFTQADTSTTREYGGTGLGLSISKRLVEMMGGEIGAEKNAGEGSLFWFTVILDKQPEGREAQAAPEQLALATISDAYVLIVDDNATNRLVLKRQLESWGFTYDEATGAQMALHKLREAHARGKPFTLAILDMQMPYMDGEELGRAIREDSLIASTLLIMMTSIGWRRESERVRELGFASFLTKPVKQSQLYDCLASALGVSRPKRPKASNDPLAVEHQLTLEQRRATRLLLVEDNPTNQIVALSILKNWGFHTDAVGNGLEALETLEDTAYDVVLMDVQMPELDGMTATRRIRSGEAKVLNPGVPIVAMTAHALKGDKERCLAAGMNDYVSKPIKVQELLQAIENQIIKPSPPLDDRGSDQAAAKDEGEHAMAELLAKVGDDVDLVGSILETFARDAAIRLGELRANDDPERVMACAHALKSATGNLGAQRAYELSLAIEDDSRNGRMDAAISRYADLEDAISDFNAMASDWLRHQREDRS